MISIVLGLNDSFSSSMWVITGLHDWAMLVLIGVVSLVSYAGVFVVSANTPFNNFLESEWLEGVWTIVPMAVLFCLSMVSLRTLYLLEEISSPDLTVNVVGHQWFWSYECDVLAGCDGDGGFSSYLVPTRELVDGGFRLLETDKPLFLPVGLETRLLVVSEDVIHSWAVPSLGLKIDAVPGRLNQMVVTVDRAGVLFGQCSEMCGAFHSFMPINLECCNLS